MIPFEMFRIDKFVETKLAQEIAQGRMREGSRWVIAKGTDFFFEMKSSKID